MTHCETVTLMQTPSPSLRQYVGERPRGLSCGQRSGRCPGPGAGASPLAQGMAPDQGMRARPTSVVDPDATPEGVAGQWSAAVVIAVAGSTSGAACRRWCWPRPPAIALPPADSPTGVSPGLCAVGAPARSPCAVQSEATASEVHGRIGVPVRRLSVLKLGFSPGQLEAQRASELLVLGRHDPHKNLRRLLKSVGRCAIASTAFTLSAPTIAATPPSCRLWRRS